MFVEPFTPDPIDPFVGRGERSAGIHVSSIIDSLLVTIGGEQAKNVGPIEEDSVWGDAATVGFLWEDAMKEAFRVQYLRSAGRVGVDLATPGELEVDGILMTPDDIESDGTVVDYKATWKSLTKSPPEAVWKWKVQLMAYCHAVGSLTAKIVALYQCGDYKPPAPRVVGRRFVFTDREVAVNWAMLVEGKGLIMRVMRGGN